MLSVGVIGTGLIATLKHLPAWQKAEQKGLAKPVALCDVDPARAREVAAKFGIPKFYGSTKEMYAAEKLDMVDVCTPPKTHAKLAIEAAAAGAHVLLEKPMATSLGECDEIMAAAQKHDRRVCLAHSDLFYPSFLKAREMVEQGVIGTFRGMRIFLATPVDYITSKADHWAHKLPGGVLGETGPHVVYMTLAFIKRIQKVQIHAQKLLPEYPWSPWEDYRITLVGERATSSIALTYTTKQWAAQVELWGDEGLLRADLESQAVVHYERDALEPKKVATSVLREAAGMIATAAAAGFDLATKRYLTTHDMLVQKFADSVVRGAPPPVPPEEGRESIRVLDMLVAELERRDGATTAAAAPPRG
jgi:predicted dehydrogenase